jgi:hypothetical protein
MTFDVGAEPGTPERERARHVAAVLVNGVDVHSRCTFVDTDAGEIEWHLLDHRGAFVRDYDENGQLIGLKSERVRVNPRALRVVPREDCPAELRW